MEFIKQNFIETTTSIAVGSNTVAAENLFNPIKQVQYRTTGFNNDNTTASITINFDSTTTVSRLVLMEHNLKSFTLFYNGATASTFSLTSTAATTVSDFSTNSETSQYFFATSVDCTSVTLDMKTTQTANAEKAVGFFCISALELDFETNGRLPAAKNYKPKRNRKEVLHRLSDGGARLTVLEEKWECSIKYKNIPLAFKEDLETIFDLKAPRNFAAFPTSSGWDEVFFEAIWPAPFDFETFSDDNPNAGFQGTIKLLETS
jgi:hypothetical protein